MSLLAIAEAKMNPGPRDLLLRGCYDCTDTGVSWLAERCPTIVCLNVLVSCGATLPMCSPPRVFLSVCSNACDVLGFACLFV